jgi:hypothetical protein
MIARAQLVEISPIDQTESLDTSVSQGPAARFSGSPAAGKKKHADRALRAAGIRERTPTTADGFAVDRRFPPFPALRKWNRASNAAE